MDYRLPQPFRPQQDERTNRPNPLMVDRLMSFVEQSLHLKLNAVESLVEKNKANLAKVKEDHRKLAETVSSLTAGAHSKSITEDIRLFFALARNDRLDLVGRVSTVEQLAPKPTPNKSRSPIATPRAKTPVKTTMNMIRSGLQANTGHQSRRSPVPSGAATSRKDNRTPTAAYQSKSPTPENNIKLDSKRTVGVGPTKPPIKTPSSNTKLPSKSPPNTGKVTPFMSKASTQSNTQRHTISNSNQSKNSKPPSKSPTPSRVTPERITPISSYSKLPRPKIPTSQKAIGSRQNSPTPTTPSHSKRDIPGDPFETSLVQAKSTSNLPKAIGSPFDETDDRIAPRLPPNIQPEMHPAPVFDEDYPSKAITPNNVSSFMELLNYNSSDDETANKKVKGRGSPEQITSVSKGQSSPTRYPRSVANLPALESPSRERSPALLNPANNISGNSYMNHSEFMPPSSPLLKYKIHAPSPRVGPGELSKSTINLRAFEKLDENLAKHPLCPFPGLPFIKPTKHSSRLAIADFPEPVNIPAISSLVVSSNFRKKSNIQRQILFCQRRYQSSKRP